MPDWSSPEEIAKEAGIFVKLLHSLLGLYAYEWFISLDFEWDFITGARRFRWPMFFYFANRYLLLFALIAIIISFDTITAVDCQSLYTFNQLAGNAAIGLASINLSIRTMAIWNFHRYITGGLILIILGHWSLILQGVQLTAEWVDGAGCQITKTNNKILAAIFIYSMFFDLMVLCLNVYKLTDVGRSKFIGVESGKSKVTGVSVKSKGIGMSGRSRIVQLVFTDGLIFFIVAFLANLVATVFMLLNLNSIMSVIFNVPAAVASTVVACRAVRRLTTFASAPAEVYGAKTASSGNRAGNSGGARVPGVDLTSSTRSGVHVQMETFSHGVEQNNSNVFTRSRKDESVDTDLEDTDVENKGQL